MYSLDNIGAGANANIWLYVYGALGIITLYLTSKTIYNLYLHPLRSIPGPFSHRASPIPYLYQTLIGRSSFHAHDLHEKYGPVVRLTPNHLSFTDIRAWKDIYGHRIPPPLPSDSPQQPHDGGHYQSQGENPKSPVHYGFFPDVPPSILEASREEHSLLRKTLSHGFSESSLRSQESRIRRYVDLLMLRLGQQQQKKQQQKVEAVDIAKYYNWITFDVTGDLVFAESFGCLERQEYHPFVGLIVGTIRGSSVLVALNYLGLGFVMTIAWRLGVGKLVGKMRGDLAQKIEKRVEISAKMGGIEVENDLFEGLMRRRVEWGIDMKKLTSNAMVLVIAGSETTATLLSGATSLLLSNPQAMEKLKTEVRSAFSSAEEITIASVNTRLPYLLACLNEALRMYPPVTGSLVRLIAKGGATVAGQVIPEGTMVECAPWAMNHSSSHWEDPWSFTPERFLHHHRDEQEGQGQQEKRDTLEALQAFSVGPRNCIGRNLAYAEMRLILANLIYSFDLRLADERGGWIESQKAYPLWARGPLYVHIEPALK